MRTEKKADPAKICKLAILIIIAALGVAGVFPGLRVMPVQAQTQTQVQTTVVSSAGKVTEEPVRTTFSLSEVRTLRAEPEPEPQPEPVVVEEPVPQPQPQPEPVVVEDPVPEPQPEPVVVEEPVPEPQPEPVVVEEPVPEPQPEPVVVEEPVPEPQPEPVVTQPTVAPGINPHTGRAMIETYPAMSPNELAKVDQIIAATLHPQMNDFEIATAINNYLCATVEYDYSYTRYCASNALFEGMIEAANRSIEDPIDLVRCRSCGIGIGVHEDGTLFYALLYK